MATTADGTHPTGIHSCFIDMSTVQAPPDKFQLVHNETRTVRKRAVGIRLKSLLVIIMRIATHILPMQSDQQIQLILTTYFTHFRDVCE